MNITRTEKIVGGVVLSICTVVGGWAYKSGIPIPLKEVRNIPPVEKYIDNNPGPQVLSTAACVRYFQDTCDADGDGILSPEELDEARKIRTRIPISRGVLLPTNLFQTRQHMGEAIKFIEQYQALDSKLFKEALQGTDATTK